MLLRLSRVLPGVLAIAAVAVLSVTAAQAGGDRELGEYLSNECVTCHQISGRNEGIPSIIGWPEESFLHALSDFRERRRDNAVMRSIAIKFTADEMAALAAYFGSLLPAHEATSSVVTNDAVQTK